MNIFALLIAHTLVAFRPDVKGDAIHNVAESVTLNQTILTNGINNLISEVKVAIDIAAEKFLCFVFRNRHCYNVTLKRPFVKRKVIHRGLIRRA